ncbi:conserved hypothetical protein [Neospora caninum Liverpool]|uniref:Uncharacterized protein n=1 Tax=Neospora caninum (strain Liverpool) TaxID=572307 RepID=F0VAF8_NEOCL|nr:conserved hypothetical protein [Neospora caninum Liverpool]CBZ50647.1 conserved hypothetical protein [Neospora caninum Liverpool]CEL65259.1 TPA: hypothetical protein BN1204_011150 [Neospora caninum Liverpool]|eukprot:XP_003880680.1 conserved hypothetical protein [Neospora caninum Liverpool]
MHPFHAGVPCGPLRSRPLVVFSAHPHSPARVFASRAAVFGQGEICRSLNIPPTRQQAFDRASANRGGPSASAGSGAEGANGREQRKGTRVGCSAFSTVGGDQVTWHATGRAFSSVRSVLHAREPFPRTSRLGLEPRKGCLKALGEREQLDLALEDDASLQEIREIWIADPSELDAAVADPLRETPHTSPGETFLNAQRDAPPCEPCGEDSASPNREGQVTTCAVGSQGTDRSPGRRERSSGGPGGLPPAPRLQVIARVRRLVEEAPERLFSQASSAARFSADAAARDAFACDPYDQAQDACFASGSVGAWRCEWTEANDCVCQFATRMTAKEILGLLALYTKLKALKVPAGASPSSATLQNLTESKRAFYALTQALLRNTASLVDGAAPGRMALPILLESLTSTQLVMLLRHLVVLEFHHQLLLLHVFHLLPRRLLLLAQEAREHDARQKGLPPPAFPDLSLAARQSPGRDEKDLANKQQNQIRQLASFIPWQRPAAFHGRPDSADPGRPPTNCAPPANCAPPTNCAPAHRKDALHMVALTFLGGSVAELARTCPSLSFWNNENTRTLVAIIEQLTILNIHETSPVQLTVLATSVCGLHTATIRFLNVLAQRASDFLNAFSFAQLTLVSNALARLHFAHGSLVKKVDALTANAPKRSDGSGSFAPRAERRVPAVRGKIVTGAAVEEASAPAAGATSFADLVAECDPRSLRSLWYRIALRAATALPKTAWRQQEFLDTSGTWIDVNEMLALEQAAAAEARAPQTPRGGGPQGIDGPTPERERESERGRESEMRAEGWEGALGFPKGRGRFLPASCLDLFKAAEISYDLSTKDDVVAYFDPAVRGGTWKRLFFPSLSGSAAHSLSSASPVSSADASVRTEDCEPSSASGEETLQAEFTGGKTHGAASGASRLEKGQDGEGFSLASLPPSPAPACGEETADGLRPFAPLRNEEIRQLINLLNSFARVVAAELVPLDDRDISAELSETFPAWASRQTSANAQKPATAGSEQSGKRSDAPQSESSPTDFSHDVVDWANVRKVCAAMVNAGADTGAAQVDNPVFLLFTRAITELIARQEHMTPQGITSFMNAYSKVRLKGHGRFFFQLKPRILKLLPEFESHQISMALNAFSYFRFDDKEVVRGLVNEFMHRRHQGASSIAVSSVILSMAALGMREESVIRAMTQGNWISNSLFFNSLSTQGLTTLLFSLVCQDAIYEAATGSAELLNKILTRLHESPLKRHGEAMLTTCARAIFPCSFLTISDHLRAVENARKHRLTGVDMSSYIRPEFQKKWISTGAKKDGGRELAWAVRPPPEVLDTPPAQWSTGLKFLADQLFCKSRTDSRAKIVPSGLHFQVAAVAHLLGYRVLNEISVFPYSIDIVVLPDAGVSDPRNERGERTDFRKRAARGHAAGDAPPGFYDMQQTEELNRLATRGVQSDGTLTRMSKVMTFRYGGYGKQP